MKTLIFKVKDSEIEMIKNVLAALGVKNIQEVESSKYPQFDQIEYTREEFERMLDFSRKTKSSETLDTKEDVIEFLKSL